MVYQLTTRDINSLINRLNPRIKSYGKRENIKTSNKYEDKICLVTEGMVYLCIENDDFERSILRIFRKGDFFSHAMILPDGQGVSYFTAKKTSSVAYFDKYELINYMTSDKEHFDMLMGIVALQLEQEPFSHSFILQQKTIRNKLLYYFRNEKMRQQANPIKMSVTYSDLAEYLGTDRSAMMKELSKMKKEGIIAEEKHMVEIMID
ncbi:MAG: Crp/Fnr family transcriptional regulator [Oscillospiraceae bacterium]